MIPPCYGYCNKGVIYIRNQAASSFRILFYIMIYFKVKQSSFLFYFTVFI